MNKEKLLPKSVLKQLPKIGETEEEKDPMVRLKLFYPDFGWTWYVIEYDLENEIFFGLVDGFEKELGSFSLKELLENRGKLGCEIERDFYFEPTPLSKLKL